MVDGRPVGRAADFVRRRFPLFWPFCVAGAIVGTAAAIVIAPFWLLSPPR